MTPASSHIVGVERQGEVAIVRMQRPPVNALNQDLVLALDAALDAELSSPDTRALVMTGSGNAFSAGIDLKLVPSYGKAQLRDLIQTINRVATRLYAAPIPVVGAINGHAIAGGLVLALATDFRFGVVGTSQLGLTEVRAGIPFPAAPLAICQAELSSTAARRLMLGGRNVSPEHALRLGILDELVEADALLSSAVAFADDLAATPAGTYRRIKHQLRAQTIARLKQIEHEGDPLLKGWLSPEAKKGADALLER